MKLKVKNFLSIAELDLELKESCVILGINQDEGGSNGSGKTALIEALVFALYGESLRGVNLEQLVRSGASSLVVGVELNGYKVTRGYTKGIGSEAKVISGNKTIMGVKNVDRVIEDKFGSFRDFMLFNCFSDKYRFSKLTETERKKLVSRFIDLDLVSRLEEKVKSKEREVDVLLSQLKIKVEMLGKFIEEKRKEIEEIEQELEQVKELAKKFKDIDEETVSKYYENKKLETELSKAIQFMNSDIFTLERKLGQLKVNICPLCGSKLDEEKVKKLRQDFEEELKKLKEDYKQVQVKLKEVKEELSKYNEEDIKNYYKVVELKSKLSQLNTLKLQLQEVRKNKQSELKKILGEKEKLEKLYDVIQFWKKKLTFKGVKSVLLQSFFQVFSEEIERYLDMFDFSYSVVFEMEEGEKLKVKLVDRKGERELETFSQGEKRKFDIATIFALQSLAGEMKFKWLFFDEVFDGLDAFSIQKILQVFERFNEEGKNFMIISHMSLSFPFKVLTVVKKNGISFVEKDGIRHLSL